MQLLTLLSLAGSALAATNIAANKLARLAVHLTNSTTGTCDALIEEHAWQLSNLESFQAEEPQATSASYFAFDFEDVNEGLELKTRCLYSLPPGSNGSVAGDGYHACNSTSVYFKYTGDTLQVDRYYRDHCLGKPPYDRAIAHGRAKPEFIKTRSSDGVRSTQTRLDMPISSLS